MQSEEVTSIVLGFIQCLIIVVFSVLTHGMRHVDPIRNKNLFLIHSTNLGYIIFGIYLILFTQFDLPDHLFPWPLYLGFSLIVAPIIAGIVSLYFRLRLSEDQYKYATTAINYLNEENLMPSKLINKANVIERELFYDIFVGVFVGVFLVLGVIATFDYERVSANGEGASSSIWLIGSVVFAVIILIIVIILSIVLLTQSKDAIGLRNEYIHLSFGIVVVLIWSLIYFGLTFATEAIESWRGAIFSVITLPLFWANTFVPWVNARYNWYWSSSRKNSFWFKLKVAFTGKSQKSKSLNLLLTDLATHNDLSISLDSDNNLSFHTMDFDGMIKEGDVKNFINAMEGKSYKEAVVIFMIRRLAMKEFACLLELISICKAGVLGAANIDRIIDIYLRPTTAKLLIDDFSSTRCLNGTYLSLKPTIKNLRREYKNWNDDVESDVVRSHLDDLRSKLSYNIHLRYWNDFKRMIGQFDSDNYSTSEVSV